MGSIMIDILANGLDRLPSHWEDMMLAEGLQMGVGGGAANSAITFARLGQPVYLAGRIGSDSFGDYGKQIIEKEGVNTEFVVRDLSQPSGVAIGLVHNEGERCFITVRGANKNLNKFDLESIDPNSTALLHINGYFQMPQLEDDMSYILEMFKKSGTMITFDTASWDPSGKWYTTIKSFVHYIDYFFANKTQLYKLTGYDDVEKAASCLIKDGVKNVVAKLGAKGCMVYGDNSVLYKNAYKVDSVDTTGAGDSFDAAFGVGLLKGWNEGKCATFANVVAALNCTKLGATSGVPRFNEALKIVEEIS